MRSLRGAVVLILLAVTFMVAETIDTSTVVALHQAGLAPEVIVNKILSAKSVRFQNSAEELLELGKAGVPTAIIEALQRRAQAEGDTTHEAPLVADVARAYGELPKEIGVFLVIDNGIVPIEQEPVKSVYTGMGLAKGMLGLRKVPVPHYVEGPKSRLASRVSRPLLLVNLPGEKLGDFRLIQALKVSNDRRELFRALAGFFTAKEVDSKEFAVRTTPIGEGYYELTPSEDLASGEYAIAHYGVEGGAPRAWPFRVAPQRAQQP